MEENVLYYGDNLHIIRQYVGDESVDLIYLDPPFNSNQSYNVLFREANVKFVNAFQDRFGRYPTYTAAIAYTAIMLYKRAVEETGTLDTQALIAALEGMEVDDMPLGLANEPCGHAPLWIRPEDHQGCYTTPLGMYVWDPDVTTQCGILTNFSNIPWCEYYRNPPDYKNP